MKTKLTAFIGAFCADLSLSLFLYFKATHFPSYLESLGNQSNSMHFQMQLYQLLLQSLTFTLILFLMSQLLFYVLAFRGKTYGKKSLAYLRLFSFFGMTFSTLIASFYSIYFIFITGIYFFAFQKFKNYSERYREPRT